MSPPGAPLPAHWPLLGWSAAAVSAVATGYLTEASSRPSPWACAFVVGQFVLFGAVQSAMVPVWRRLVRSGSWWRWPAAWLGSAIGCLPVLGDDVVNRAAKIAFVGPTWLWQMVLVAALAVALPISLALGAILARWRLGRLFALALGVGLAAANQSTLQRNYPGLHLEIAGCEAFLVGPSLAVLLDSTISRGRRRLWVDAVAATWAAWALVATPSPAVAVGLSRLSGFATAPFVARLQASVADLRRQRHDRAPEKRTDTPPSEPTILPPDGAVVLITVDSLRAELLLDERFRRDLPHLFELRDSSVFFANARSAAPATTASLAAIFTSRYYSQLFWTFKRVRRHQRLMPHLDESTRFPEVLSRTGVRTISLLSDEGFLQEHGVLRGFQQESSFGASIRGTTLMRRVIRRLRAESSGPLFLYAHLFDPHAPYDGKGTPFERYLEDVKIVDKAVGELMAAVKRLPFGDRTAIIVTADHGEAFGEHNTRFHGATVYDELLRVPLVVHAPGIAPRRVDDAVSLIDLGPTILDLFGRATPGSFMGQTLTPCLRAAPLVARRPVVADSGHRMQAMVFPDRTKIIRDVRTATLELYDLERDPAELTNRFQPGDVVSDAKKAELIDFFDAHELRRAGYEIPYKP